MNAPKALQVVGTLAAAALDEPPVTSGLVRELARENGELRGALRAVLVVVDQVDEEVDG